MAKKRILVLDDELGMTRLLKLGLERTGQYEVRVENHGGRAVAAALEFRPDLILLDLVMPDVTGEDVLREIRAKPDLRTVPVLLLTASVREGRGPSRIAGLPWITKPVRVEALVEHIERQLIPSGPPGSGPGR